MANGLLDIQSLFPEEAGKSLAQRQQEAMLRQTQLAAMRPRFAIGTGLLDASREKHFNRARQALSGAFGRGMLSGEQNLQRSMQDYARSGDEQALERALSQYNPEALPGLQRLREQRRLQQRAEEVENRQLNLQERQVATGELNAQVNMSQNALDYAVKLRDDVQGNTGKISMATPLGGGYIQVAYADGGRTEIFRAGSNDPIPPEEVPQVLADIRSQEREDMIAAQRAREQEGIKGRMLEQNLEATAVLYEGTTTLMQVIREIESGADTGPIRNRIPTFNRHTSEIRRLFNQMGLDVVARTTFGALSEGELRLALETAVDRNLQEDQIKEQLAERVRLQTILMDQMRDVSRQLALGRDLSEVIETINKNQDTYSRAILDDKPDRTDAERRAAFLETINTNSTVSGSGPRGRRPR